MGTSDFTATYGIEIAVEGTDSAEDAAKALSDLRDRITEDTTALGEMNKAMRSMQAGTVVSAQAFRTLRAQIAAKRESLSQASQQLVLYSKKFPGLNDALRKTKQAEKEHAAGLQALRGELFGAESRFFGLRMATLRSVGPVLGLAAAYAAVSIAVIAAVVAVTKFGLATADARRNEQIDVQAAGTRIWYGYGNAVMFAADETEKGAKAISGAIDRVATSTTIGRDRILGFTKELEAAGLRGQALETSLKAVSTAASVGKEAGLVGLFASLRFAGQGVDALAARIQTKLGPLVERKMLSLDAQFSRFKENLGQLFKNIDATPILRALDKILGLFSQTKAVGYSLRIALEALFPSKSAQTFGDIAVQVFKEVVIQGLRVSLGFLTLELMYYRLRNAAKKAFDVDIVRAWWTVFKTALAETVSFLAKIVPGLQVISTLSDLGAAAGKGIADGVRDGVRDGAPEVYDATSDLGSHATQGFREKLQIHSPSKIFYEDARDNVAGATAKGLRAGADGVQDAADSMGPAARASGAKGGGPAQISIVFNEGAIQLKGGSTAEQAADLEDQLSAALERAAQRYGAQLEVA